MILTPDDLNQLSGKVVLVDGGFDPLHDGHIRYFELAAELGLPVLCHVTNDDYVRTKHEVLLEQAKRARVIQALRPVTHVLVSTLPTNEVIRAVRPAYYVKGIDWCNRLPQAEQDTCAEIGTEIRYVDADLNSSSDIVTNFMRRSIEAGYDRFEAFVASQTCTTDADFSRDYFHEAWRAGQFDYSVESRRKIEGKNPQLIRDVFRPAAAIDIGCGPGALMYLLHEIGVVCDGLDFSPEAIATAPEAVRHRIRQGSIASDTGIPDRAYDLVICREVMEHLPVRDVFKAVRELCRISSRYIYLTTRFNFAPRDIFHVATEFDVDPTHITLLCKELMRTFFLYEGFQRCIDLERRMDWLGKNRVLVYERSR